MLNFDLYFLRFFRIFRDILSIFVRIGLLVLWKSMATALEVEHLSKHLTYRVLYDDFYNLRFFIFLDL